MLHNFSGNPGGTLFDKYHQGGIVYDKNGNIMELECNGLVNSTDYGIMDDLVYKYYPYSNQLRSVADNATSQGFNNGTTATDDDYAYDLNGNMTEDLNKGIVKIDYNHLNLTESIYFSNGGYIGYVYDATGIKLEKRIDDNGDETSTQYDNGFIYENNELQYFSHPEGYVKRENNLSSYIYQYKDHLGNVRLSYADANNDGTVSNNEIIEENNYYPFGMKHKGYNTTVTSTNIAQKIKYNGKELEEELGKDTYAYGWRDYDPAIGRFLKIDRFAEKYYKLTTYNYSGNSPIIFRDIAGDSINVTRLLAFDKATNGNTTEKIINDFSAITGMNVSVNESTGLVEYEKDGNDNAIIRETNGIKEGSATARADLIDVINGPEIEVMGGRRSVTAGNQIAMGSPQIDAFINGTPKCLDNRTLGYSMVLLHEFRHTTAMDQLQIQHVGVMVQDQSLIGLTFIEMNWITILQLQVIVSLVNACNIIHNQEVADHQLIFNIRL